VLIACVYGAPLACVHSNAARRFKFFCIHSFAI
jgi:hypothetical protein